ncbi:MAG: hypothetical protein GF383_08610 [Candidatus Lokiarchaeota archaeon]|nr:hypothetical protein [Candidatus Lokiarchaeota archaeon]
MSKDPSEIRTIHPQSERRNSDKPRYCSWCLQEIHNGNEYFVDIMGVLFCSRECFYHAKSRRDPKIYLLQKEYDRHAPRTNLFSLPRQKYRHLWNRHLES